MSDLSLSFLISTMKIKSTSLRVKCYNTARHVAAVVFIFLQAQLCTLVG